MIWGQYTVEKIKVDIITISDDWDEIYPSLDVYYSLVDHGDFD